MSGNYPPGVTGNEPQIRGPLSEFTVHRYCDQDSVAYVPAFVVAEVLEQFSGALAQSQSGGLTEIAQERFLAGARDRLELHVAEFACDWEGDVDVQLWDGGIINWTCPRCGSEHEDDYAEELRGDDL